MADDTPKKSTPHVNGSTNNLNSLQPDNPPNRDSSTNTTSENLVNAKTAIQSDSDKEHDSGGMQEQQNETKNSRNASEQNGKSKNEISGSEKSGRIVTKKSKTILGAVIGLIAAIVALISTIIDRDPKDDPKTEDHGIKIINVISESGNMQNIGGQQQDLQHYGQPKPAHDIEGSSPSKQCDGRIRIDDSESKFPLKFRIDVDLIMPQSDSLEGRFYAFEAKTKEDGEIEYYYKCKLHAKEAITGKGSKGGRWSCSIENFGQDAKAGDERDIAVLYLEKSALAKVTDRTDKQKYSEIHFEQDYSVCMIYPVSIDKR